MVIEDVSPCLATEVAIKLVIDTGACRVDQVDQWHLAAKSQFLHLRDLQERCVSPGTRLHSNVVGDDGDFAPMNSPHASNHCVCRKVPLAPSQKAVFKQHSLVEQFAQTITDQYLSLCLMAFTRFSASSGKCSCIVFCQSGT